MELDADQDSDSQSLGGTTLASVGQVEDRDQCELLGAGSSKPNHNHR
jgi:hypothetical protein